jgi:hypothetical protein
LQAPECWLEWVGWRKLVFGVHANRKWHYTGPLGQPTRHIKWFLRSAGSPQTETILNLWYSLVAWATCSPPPWTVLAREAEAEEAEEAAAAAAEGDAPAGADDGAGSEKAPSTSSSVRSARNMARYKRMMTATGFIGTYVCWAIFAWCVSRAPLVHRPDNFVVAHASVSLRTSCRRLQVHLRVRHAHLQVAGRQGAAGVRALLGCVVLCHAFPPVLECTLRRPDAGAASSDFLTFVFASCAHRCFLRPQRGRRVEGAHAAGALLLRLPLQCCTHAC